jgi:tetratricopeptide (TPR) repeat protein
MDRLVDHLWGEEVPGSARKMVQIFVSQLRKRLPEGLVRTRGRGYVVDLEGHTLDLRRFDALVAEGRELLSRGLPEQAAERFDDALSLWRGPALGEFEEPFALLESSRLEEQRLACLEERIEAELGAGRHAEVVGELDTLVRRHPHRERLREQLMLALYRSGRHPEALESATGAGIMRPYFLGLLGAADAEAGRLVDAVAAFDEGLALAEANEERYFEAELLRLRGEALLTGPEPDTAGAEGDFHRALELAGDQRAAPLVLRAALSTARLAVRRRRDTEARAVLAEACESCGEGFDMPELRAARELLAQLDG